MLYPDPDKAGRGKKGKATETVGFSQQRLREARQVLAYSRDLALAVRDGTESLDAALATVTAERQKLDTKETKLARLQKAAPDLAELVTEERMTLDDAIAALDERERKAAAEERMRARWCLGLALELVVRGAGPGRGKKDGGDRPSFKAYVRDLELKETSAKEAQRIAALPDEVLTKAFEKWRTRDDLLHYSDLMLIARPYWAKVHREIKHRIFSRSMKRQARPRDRGGKSAAGRSLEARHGPPGQVVHTGRRWEKRPDPRQDRQVCRGIRPPSRKDHRRDDGGAGRAANSASTLILVAPGCAPDRGNEARAGLLPLPATPVSDRYSPVCCVSLRPSLNARPCKG